MGKVSIGRTALPIETIRKESGYAALSQPFPAEVMIRDLDVRLSENGVEIRRDPLSTSDSVREKGGGEFMIWNDGTILFSATDSSDPAVNGRVYAITLPKILPKRMVKIVYAATLIAALLLALESNTLIMKNNVNDTTDEIQVTVNNNNEKTEEDEELKGMFNSEDQF